MVAMRSFAERLADENLGLLVVILIAFEDEILWINFGADAEGDTGRVGPLFDNHVHKKLLELSGGNCAGPAAMNITPGCVLRSHTPTQ